MRVEHADREAGAAARESQQPLARELAGAGQDLAQIVCVPAEGLGLGFDAAARGQAAALVDRRAQAQGMPRIAMPQVVGGPPMLCESASFAFLT